jgi:hypothetical protein
MIDRFRMSGGALPLHGCASRAAGAADQPVEVGLRLELTGRGDEPARSGERA